MKISIDTNVLKKHKLSLEQFIILLSSYYNLDYQKLQEELLDKGLAQKNLFKDFPPVISDNTRKLIAKVIVDSDSKIANSGIDFDKLAKALQGYYPEGIKAGKTYPWRGTVEEIALRLKTLIVKYDFVFTEEEAITAVKEYVSGFKAPYTFMYLLKNFLLYTKKEDNGHYEVDSLFMTIIENNRSLSTNEDSN